MNLIVVVFFLFVFCLFFDCLFVFVLRHIQHFVLNLYHDIFPKSTSYFCVVCFCLLQLEGLHTFDQHSHTRRSLTPLAVLFSTVCVCVCVCVWGGGVKGYRGKFKRCGLGSGFLKCSGFNVF